MTEGTQRTPKLAFGHLFWWFMFANGGGLAALVLPVHILVQGILGPIGIPVVDRHYDTWISILGNPIVKLYLLVLIALPFFHFAHRLRYLLVDLGVPAAKSIGIFFLGAMFSSDRIWRACVSTIRSHSTFSSATPSMCMAYSFEIG